MCLQAAFRGLIPREVQANHSRGQPLFRAMQYWQKFISRYRDGSGLETMTVIFMRLNKSILDIGPMIAALLSDDNRWVNAQLIEVSGGMGL